MKFRVVEGFARPESLRDESLVILRKDNWDDFGFKTLFQAELLTAGGELIELGPVKILKAGQTSGFTPLSGALLDGLDSTYCSLGQDVE